MPPGLPCRYISAPYQHHISIPEVPTPLGLLSSPSGITVISLALVEIPMQLGRDTGAYLFFARYFTIC